MPRTPKKKRSRTAKFKKIKQKIYKTGDRLLHGTVIGAWIDPQLPTVQWLLMDNDDPNAPKNSYTLYKYMTLSSYSNEFLLPHFIPGEILASIGELNIPPIKKKRRKRRKKKTDEAQAAESKETTNST